MANLPLKGVFPLVILFLYGPREHAISHGENRGWGGILMAHSARVVRRAIINQTALEHTIRAYRVESPFSKVTKFFNGETGWACCRPCVTEHYPQVDDMFGTSEAYGDAVGTVPLIMRMQDQLEQRNTPRAIFKRKLAEIRELVEKELERNRTASASKSSSGSKSSKSGNSKNKGSSPKKGVTVDERGMAYQPEEWGNKENKCCPVCPQEMVAAIEISSEYTTWSSQREENEEGGEDISIGGKPKSSSKKKSNSKSSSSKKSSSKSSSSSKASSKSKSSSSSKLASSSSSPGPLAGLSAAVKNRIKAENYGERNRYLNVPMTSLDMPPCCRFCDAPYSKKRYADVVSLPYQKYHYTGDGKTFGFRGPTVPHMQRDYRPVIFAETESVSSSSSSASALSSSTSEENMNSQKISQASSQSEAKGSQGVFPIKGYSPAKPAPQCCQDCTVPPETGENSILKWDNLQAGFEVPQEAFKPIYVH
eukprot:jgi/Bigna1/140087/aug1.54_g14795